MKSHEKHNTLTHADIKAMLGHRNPNSHKGDNGRGLLVAGSEGMGGAVVLCAAAAQRTGIGTLKVCTTVEVVPAMHVLPEVMALAVAQNNWREVDYEKLSTLINEADCVCIGPGLGKGTVREMLLTLALNAHKPTVIDADGLNTLAAMPNFAMHLHPGVILTPHIGEMSRLCGANANDIINNQLDYAVNFASRWGCTVLLKSAISTIASPDGRFALNATGNSGLAKGGSGDVLAGIILAMIGQKLSQFSAACVGAYLLGASADEALLLLGERMLMARDVIDVIQSTINNFNNN